MIQPQQVLKGLFPQLGPMVQDNGSRDAKVRYNTLWHNLNDNFVFMDEIVWLRSILKSIQLPQIKISSTS